MDTIRISQSRCNVLNHCGQHYVWTYKENLVPRQKSRPLMVGDVVHRLRHSWITGELQPSDILNLPQKVASLFPEVKGPVEEVAYESAALFNCYLEMWKNDPVDYLSPEMILEKELVEPKTGTPFILYTRLDAMCRKRDGTIWREELKTTSKIDHAYLSGLKGGLQTGIAHWLIEELLPYVVNGTVFNLLVKTKIPYAKRQTIFFPDWTIQTAKEAVYGTVRRIAKNDFYPSLNCQQYFGDCDYLPLCRSDSPATREAFYQTREEVISSNVSGSESDTNHFV